MQKKDKYLPIQPFSEWCEQVFFRKDYDFETAKNSPLINKKDDEPKREIKKIIKETES